MEWRDYLEERINAAPVLAKEHTKDIFVERAMILRTMAFANSFYEGRGGDARIIIMYGLRGIGKSTILFQMYNRLRAGRFNNIAVKSKEIPQENILYLSIDQALLSTQLKSESPIYDAVKYFCETIHNQKLESLDKKLFILVDEAQFDKRWAVAAKSLFDASKNIFLVITGSSALALNIDTDTARRAIKEPLFPLSFMEYQMIKNNIFPQKGNAENFKKLIFNNDRHVIPELNEAIRKIQFSLKGKGLTIEKELLEYLTLGGLPNGNLTSKEVAYRRIVDMINRIVSQDMPEISNFETGSIPEIMRIIGAIALTPAGELSQNKISTRFGISAAKVNTIIDTLQKTHLIFTIKAFSTKETQKGLVKGFKYYFMSSTLSSAIKYMNGMTILKDTEIASLWENAVAATLFKLCYTTGTIYSLFYDSREEGNVDFILQNPISGEIIPFEVGLNKDNKQVKDALEHYPSRYGIVISDVPEITFTDKIIKVPFWFFLYL